MKTILIALALLPTNLVLASYEIVAKVQMKANQKHFTRQDNSYRQDRSSSDISIQVTGTGILVMLDKSFQKKETRVPGKEIRGHSFATLENTPNGPLLSVDMLIDDTFEQVNVNFPLKYQAPAELTRGNWDDYVAGKEVELKLTLAGQELSNKEALEKLKLVAKTAQAKAEEKVAGLGGKISEIRVNQFVSKPTYIRVHRDEMEIIDGDTEAELSATVDF